MNAKTTRTTKAAKATGHGGLRPRAGRKPVHMKLTNAQSVRVMEQTTTGEFVADATGVVELRATVVVTGRNSMALRFDDGSTLSIFTN